MLGAAVCSRAGIASSRLQFVTFVLLQAVIITGVGLEVTLSPPVLTVFEGEDTIFTCSPLIVPIAAPLLEQDGFVVTREDYPRISFVDNLSGEGNRTYTLRDVERSDNGTWFRCSVAGFPSNITTVIVYTLPQITGQSGLVTILEGNPTPTILRYSTVGIPQPHSYQWLHNGAPFQGNDRVRVTTGHNSSLEVRAPNREDSGSYTLVATSIAGQGTLTLELQIAYDEYLEVPQSQVVPEGAVVTLRCVHRFGWSYTWRSNKRYITRSDSKVSINPTGRTLRYGPVDYTDDLMDFYCVTRLVNGHYYTSPSALLRVLSPPVIQSLQNYTAIEGSDIVITFNLLGHPSPHTLQYFMNGINLDLTVNSGGSNRITLLADRQGSLLIRGVKRADAGVYSLLARNSVGESSASTQLIVLHAPIIIPHQEPVVVQINRQAMVPCGQQVLSFPRASFTWTKRIQTGEKRELHFSIDPNNGSLTLNVPNYSDSGTYTCTAENSIGTTSTNVMVLVLDPPDPPQNLRVLHVGPTWATMQWSPVPPENVSRPLLPLSLYQIVATPLLDIVYYRASEHDIIGQSNSDDSVPISSSRRMSRMEEQNQDQEFFLDDKFANLSKGFDPNTTCVEVMCERILVRIDAKFTTFNLSGLIPALGYEVVIHSLSNGTNLISGPSDPVSVTTQHFVPHIGSVTGTVYGPGAAHVSWTLAFSGGRPVEFFEIGFKKVNDSEWQQEHVIPFDRSNTNSSYGIPPDFRSWLVTRLEAEEQYLFRVRAMNELGYGNYTASLVPILSHEFGVPSPHSRPVISGWADDYALITSSISKVGLPSGDNVTVFVILMQSGLEVERQTFELPTDYVLGSEIEFKFANLSYRGDWQFTVTGSNALGESIPSPPSLHARDSIQELHTAYTVAGPVMGCLMGVLNLAVLTMVVILFTVMGQETHRQQRNLARRRVEMAQAEDPDIDNPEPGPGVECPFSTHSLIFRSSPDGRSNTHVTPSESIYAEISHRTCPITFTFPSSTSSCTAV